MSTETTLKWKVEWEDLIELPSRIRLTRPWGCGQGRGRGRGTGRLPSQHITSPETLKYIVRSKTHNVHGSFTPSAVLQLKHRLHPHEGILECRDCTIEREGT